MASFLALMFRNGEHGELWVVLIAFGVGLLFSCYLIFDTMLILGKNSIKFSIDDYIIAALSLYIDILRIFLEVLRILAAVRR